MTSEPEKAMGALDIKNLLDLLNASEGSGVANDVSAAMVCELELGEAQPVLSVKTPRANSLDHRSVPNHTEARIPDVVENPYLPDSLDNECPQDDAENRFAVHIVQGMSKLKRG